MTMKCAIVLISLVAFAVAQQSQPQSSVIVPPGGGGCIRCTAQAGFPAFLNGRQTFIRCNSGGASTYGNCFECCSAYAIWLRKNVIDGTGFLTQASQCICCTPC